MERQNAQPAHSIPQPADEIGGQTLTVDAQPLAGGPTCLRAVGVIDRGTAPILAQRLIEEARKCSIQPARLLLDLEQVIYLDRTGLDVLLQAHARLTNAFVTMQLTEPTPHVIRLLHEANLDGASSIRPQDQ